MADVQAFKALRFTSKAGEMADLVSPPYDVISDAEREQLVEKNPYNVIRLELPVGEDKYKIAGETLQQWLQNDILEIDDQAAFYIYEEEFVAYGEKHKIKGLICRVRLEEFEKKVVLPHELTLSTPKEDRFRLMKYTGCNFSSIYCMYRDKKQEIYPLIEKLSQGIPEESFTTDDGIKHNLWLVREEETIAQITKSFIEEQLYIADGHHRYTTMINYRDSLKEQGVITDENHPANFGLLTLMNIDHPGLIVFPTHRLVRDVENFDIDTILAGCKEYFSVEEVQPKVLEDTINTIGNNGEKAFGLYHQGKGWVLTLSNKEIMKELLPEYSEAYRNLDVAILHTLLLERIFGIDKENLANQKNLTYVRDAQDVMNKVDIGEGNCAFLINSTKVSEIAAIADADEKMPQKSTYFYPKLITGHVMNWMLDVE